MYSPREVSMHRLSLEFLTLFGIAPPELISIAAANGQKDGTLCSMRGVRGSPDACSTSPNRNAGGANGFEWT